MCLGFGVGADVTLLFVFKNFVDCEEYAGFFDIAKLVVDGRAKGSHRWRQAHIGVDKWRYVVAVLAYGGI